VTVYYNDIDVNACRWLEELILAGEIPDGIVDNRSILDVDPADLVGFSQCHFFAGIGGWPRAFRLAGIEGIERIWSGSPPCQPFSVSGLKKGKNDERHLSPHFAELVRSCRPDLLFGEQVASSDVFGIFSKGIGKSSEEEPQWSWLDDLSDRLEAAHYTVGASDIPAAGVGAPHARQRTFFVAAAIDMADAKISGGGALDRQSGASNQPSVAAGGCGVSGHAMADATPVGRREECADAGRQSGGDRTQGQPAGLGAGSGDLQPGSVNGFWRDADWLLCRDGKWRPVEPGTFPLAHGIPARVGRLRGYGNAISPEVAKVFIESSIESLYETFRQGGQRDQDVGLARFIERFV
jgi:DNA (cytosine-5)-methyltransferase 1